MTQVIGKWYVRKLKDVEGKPRKAKPWQAVWTVNGKEASKCFRLKGQAEAHLRETRDEVKGDTYADLKLGKITVGAWMARMPPRPGQGASARKRTAWIRESMILPTFGDTAIASVDQEAVQVWITDLGKRYVEDTVRKAYDVLTYVFTTAIRKGLIGKMPYPTDRHAPDRILFEKSIAPEKRFLEVPEINLLAGAIHPRYRALVLLDTKTGLRIGEIQGLRVTDIDTTRRTLSVNRTWSKAERRFMPPKGKSRRTISISREAVAILLAHLMEYPPGPDGLVFTTETGKMIDQDNFREDVFSPAVAASIGGRCTPHDLRHMHASILIKANEHPLVIQHRLGHASIKITMDTYGHLMRRVGEGAAEAAERIFQEDAEPAARSDLRGNFEGTSDLTLAEPEGENPL